MKSGETRFIVKKLDTKKPYNSVGFRLSNGKTTIKKSTDATDTKDKVLVQDGVFLIPLQQADTNALQGNVTLEAQINYQDHSVIMSDDNFLYINSSLGYDAIQGSEPAQDDGIEVVMTAIEEGVAVIVNPEASQELIDAVTDLFQDTKEIAQSVRDDADAGEFDGYSPQVTVKTETPSTYILHIKDADHEYDTPNLQGQGGEGTIEAGDGLKRVGNEISADLDDNSILEFNNHKLSADTSGLQPTITGGNGIDVSSDVVSVDIKNYIDRQYLKFTDGKLDVSLLNLGKFDLRTYLTTDYQELGEPTPLVNKTYVDNLISTSLKRLVVEQLPQNPNTYTIYMVLRQAPTTNNIYDEYMYINNAWELIGSTEVDLSNYYTKSEVYNKQESNTYYQSTLTTGNGIDIIGSEISAKIAGSGNILKFSGGELAVLGSDVANDTSFQSTMPYITAIRQALTTGSNSPLQPKLTAGTNITIDANNVISASGGGSYTFTDGLKESSGTVGIDLASGSKLLIDGNDKLDVDLSSKQDTIDSTHKLSADNVDDTNTTNKFVSATEKQTWNAKADNTTISTDTTSTTVSLTLADNHEYRYRTLTSLTLTMPNGDFIASIVFASGSTPTSMTYDSSIKWSGDDVTNGQFVPTADKDYDIMMYYNGLNVNGIVRGV